MTSGLRLIAVLYAVVVLLGCGESRTTMDTRTYHGAFNMIVAEVENLGMQVNFESYKGLHNPIEDQLGSAIYAFMRCEEVEGTPLEAEAQKLLDQAEQIEKIWRSQDRSVEKIRAAAQEMQDQVDHMTTMIQ